MSRVDNRVTGYNLSGMNEPIEFAQKITGKVTVRQLREVLKHVGRYASVGIHGRATYERASWSDSFLFEVSATKRDKGVEIREEIKVPGYVSNGYKGAPTLRAGNRPFPDSWEYTETFRPTEGFWYLGLSETLYNLLDILPSNAEIAFFVYLDAATHSGLAKAGLHGDRLYLKAKYVLRGKTVEREFLVDEHTGEHTTSRFGGPNPFA